MQPLEWPLGLPGRSATQRWLQPTDSSVSPRASSASASAKHHERARPHEGDGALEGGGGRAVAILEDGVGERRDAPQVRRVGLQSRARRRDAQTPGPRRHDSDRRRRPGGRGPARRRRSGEAFERERLGAERRRSSDAATHSLASMAAPGSPSVAARARRSPARTRCPVSRRLGGRLGRERARVRSFGARVVSERSGAQPCQLDQVDGALRGALGLGAAHLEPRRDRIEHPGLDQQRVEGFPFDAADGAVELVIERLAQNDCRRPSPLAPTSAARRATPPGPGTPVPGQSRLRRARGREAPPRLRRARRRVSSARASARATASLAGSMANARQRSSSSASYWAASARRRAAST